ncbi:hypothetical protein EV284_1033 [Streptomyces sp. BK022]|uniref:hypothetical protein n=1 Tax=Streptomyces sp. BK022 TaxID=2512123 RepID=UPI00102A9FD2|nr:hypothetical protein [Streptomyces sp. BK022]RZU46361.1 hypothetical protein EV284_1033 [Streptomyces sp. BK022]
MGRIRVGRPQVRPDTPTHVAGLHEGNRGPCQKQVGHHEDGTADSRRSTGVRAKRHNAILDVMPNIPPG